MLSSEENATQGDGATRVVDVTGLPDTVVAAMTALAEQARQSSFTGVSRERMGDLVQAAEVVNGFADACLLEPEPVFREQLRSTPGAPVSRPRTVPPGTENNCDCWDFASEGLSVVASKIGHIRQRQQATGGDR